jgi:hypothetical protein
MSHKKIADIQIGDNVYIIDDYNDIIGILEYYDLADDIDAANFCGKLCSVLELPELLQVSLYLKSKW